MMNVMSGAGNPTGETQFFNENGILVTNARIVVGSTVYPLGHVTSATPITEPAKKMGPAALAVFGLLSAMASIFVKAPGILWLALPLLFGGGIAFVFAKAKHYLFVTTSAGRITLMSTNDAMAVQRLSAAISQAMIARG